MKCWLLDFFEWQVSFGGVDVGDAEVGGCVVGADGAGGEAVAGAPCSAVDGTGDLAGAAKGLGVFRDRRSLGGVRNLSRVMPGLLRAKVLPPTV